MKGGILKMEFYVSDKALKATDISAVELRAKVDEVMKEFKNVNDIEAELDGNLFSVIGNYKSITEFMKSKDYLKDEVDEFDIPDEIIAKAYTVFKDLAGKTSINIDSYAQDKILCSPEGYTGVYTTDKRFNEKLVVTLELKDSILEINKKSIINLREQLADYGFMYMIFEGLEAPFEIFTYEECIEQINAPFYDEFSDNLEIYFFDTEEQADAFIKSTKNIKDKLLKVFKHDRSLFYSLINNVI